jgi:RNA polymerase sigma factor (sigma-70 family)
VCLAELDPVLDRDQMDHLEALVEKREREKELREVMDALLTKEEVFLINAKYVEGLKYEQLAEYMEKPVGTLKSAIKRAKAKVRAGLEQKWAFS